MEGHPVATLLLQAVAEGVTAIPWDRLRHTNNKSRSAATMFMLNAVRWKRRTKILDVQLSKMLSLLPLVEKRQEYLNRLEEVHAELRALYYPEMRPEVQEAQAATDKHAKRLASLWNQHFGGAKNGQTADVPTAD